MWLHNCITIPYCQPYGLCSILLSFISTFGRIIAYTGFEPVSVGRKPACPSSRRIGHTITNLHTSSFSPLLKSYGELVKLGVYYLGDFSALISSRVFLIDFKSDLTSCMSASVATAGSPPKKMPFCRARSVHPHMITESNATAQKILLICSLSVNFNYTLIPPAPQVRFPPNHCQFSFYTLCGFRYSSHGADTHSSWESRLRTCMHKVNSFAAYQLAYLPKYITVFLQRFKLNSSTNGRAILKVFKDLPLSCCFWHCPRIL